MADQRSPASLSSSNVSPNELRLRQVSGKPSSSSQANNLSAWRLNYKALMTALFFKPFQRFYTVPNRVSLAKVSLVSPISHFSVDPCYVSFSIDISVVAGGFWWEGSTGVRKGLGTIRVPPIDLTVPKLDKLVQALGPAYLRVGGSEADKIHYLTSPNVGADDLVLTEGIWDRLHAFVERNKLKFSFTFKYGLFQRKQHGAWHGNEVEHLLQHSQAKGFDLNVCELGNELNAYWAFHGINAQPKSKPLAEDYKRFDALVKKYLPNARIIGPGSAFWPLLGETLKPFSNLTRGFLSACGDNGMKLDIVDWHYYPFQSERAPVSTRRATPRRFLSPRALNDFARYAKQIKHYRDHFCPHAEIWVGETGSAQCGGQPKSSDRFASSFWYADQLGMAAQTGHSVMVRQSLIGGDYGLISRLTLKPRPDYWVAWLWGRLMGEKVYQTQVSHRFLRVYCHETPNLLHENARTYLVINLSAKPIRIDLSTLGVLIQRYDISAKKLTSKKVRINGKKARFNGGDVALSHFGIGEMNGQIPGHAIGFWVLKSL